jgi:hypothetical protein
LLNMVSPQTHANIYMHGVYTVYTIGAELYMTGGGGMQQRIWFWNFATNQKRAGLISYGVNGFFNVPNPSNSTMDLGSTQPLTEMSIRN